MKALHGTPTQRIVMENEQNDAKYMVKVVLQSFLCSPNFDTIWILLIKNLLILQYIITIYTTTYS